MTTLDSSWLKFWEFVSEFGFIMVIVGVVGEGTELVVEWVERRKGKATAPKKPGWLLPVETFSFAILVVGLAMEFLGSHNAMRIADAENAKLNLEAKQAGKNAAASYENAAVAKREAGEANDRAANTESNNLVLQAKVLELEANAKDRIITPAQKEIFIHFLKDAPTGVVRLGWRNMTAECITFVAGIKDMLIDSGYNVASYIDYNGDQFVPLPLPKGNGLWFIINRSDQRPAFLPALIARFQSIGIVPAFATNGDPDRKYQYQRGVDFRSQQRMIQIYTCMTEFHAKPQEVKPPLFQIETLPLFCAH